MRRHIMPTSMRQHSLALKIPPPVAVLACAALMYGAAAWAGAADGYTLYVNERYGYAIEYPSRFIPQGVSANGDGQAFLSRAGDAALRVFARACIEGREEKPGDYLAALAAEAKKAGFKVTYQRKGKGYAVASGLQNGKIFYYKLLTDGNWCTHMNFTYPESQKALYDGATARIAASFAR